MPKILTTEYIIFFHNKLSQENFKHAISLTELAFSIVVIKFFIVNRQEKETQ
jgi:hypothetical protein